jgi:hypothetical protein
VLVVRPVTSAGKPAAGYRIAHTYRNSGLDCSDASSSPGAVDPNIDFCSPSAAYAVACWKAPAPHTVLCLQNFGSHQLIRFKGVHGFTQVAAPTAAERTPVRLLLGDSTKCSIRDGGAWGGLPHHPKWYGTYSCTKHGAVWSKNGLPTGGVDQSTDPWTVHTGSFSGTGKLTVRKVATAYEVGTAS